MAFQNYTTRFETQIVGGYTAGSGVLNVVTTSGITAISRVILVVAATGAFITILKVTGINSGSQFAVTVESGFTDTNAASGDVVRTLVTATQLDDIRADQVQTGAFASAVSDRKGNLYLPNDAVVALRDTGSVMSPWGPIWGLSDPQLQTWTQTNFGSCTSDTTHGGVDIYNPTVEGAFNIRSLLKSAPSTPYHCEFGFLVMTNFVTNEMVGACFSDGTKYEIFSPFFQGQLARLVEFYCSTATVQNATPINLTTGPVFWGPMLWVRLGDDGANKTIDVSVDGFRWFQVGTEARTTNLTASKVGFYVNGGVQQIRLLHYKETA